MAWPLAHHGEKVGRLTIGVEGSELPAEWNVGPQGEDPSVEPDPPSGSLVHTGRPVISEIYDGTAEGEWYTAIKGQDVTWTVTTPVTLDSGAHWQLYVVQQLLEGEDRFAVDAYKDYQDGGPALVTPISIRQFNGNPGRTFTAGTTEDTVATGVILNQRWHTDPDDGTRRPIIGVGLYRVTDYVSDILLGSEGGAWGVHDPDNERWYYGAKISAPHEPGGPLAEPVFPIGRFQDPPPIEVEQISLAESVAYGDGFTGWRGWSFTAPAAGRYVFDTFLSTLTGGGTSPDFLTAIYVLREDGNALEMRSYPRSLTDQRAWTFVDMVEDETITVICLGVADPSDLDEPFSLVLRSNGVGVVPSTITEWTDNFEDGVLGEGLGAPWYPSNVVYQNTQVRAGTLGAGASAASGFATRDVPSGAEIVKASLWVKIIDNPSGVEARSGPLIFDGVSQISGWDYLATGARAQILSVQYYDGTTQQTLFPGEAPPGIGDPGFGDPLDPGVVTLPLGEWNHLTIDRETDPTEINFRVVTPTDDVVMDETVPNLGSQGSTLQINTGGSGTQMPVYVDDVVLRYRTYETPEEVLYEVEEPDPVEEVETAELVLNGPSASMPFSSIHRGAMALAGLETLAAQIQLTAEVECWVQPTIHYYTLDDTNTLMPGQVDNFGPRILFGPSLEIWTQVDIYARAVEGYTHWRPGFRFFGTADGDAAPALGTEIFYDCAFVPDNGSSVADEPYLDGDQPGAIWEGEHKKSSSTYGTYPEPEPLPWEDDVIAYSGEWWSRLEAESPDPAFHEVNIAPGEANIPGFTRRFLPAGLSSVWPASPANWKRTGGTGNIPYEQSLYLRKKAGPGLSMRARIDCVIQVYVDGVLLTTKNTTGEHLIDLPDNGGLVTVVAKRLVRSGDDGWYVDLTLIPRPIIKVGEYSNEQSGTNHTVTSVPIPTGSGGYTIQPGDLIVLALNGRTAVGCSDPRMTQVLPPTNNKALYVGYYDGGALSIPVTVSGGGGAFTMWTGVSCVVFRGPTINGETKQLAFDLDRVAQSSPSGDIPALPAGANYADGALAVQLITGGIGGAYGTNTYTRMEPWRHLHSSKGSYAVQYVYRLENPSVGVAVQPHTDPGDGWMIYIIALRRYRDS